MRTLLIGLLATAYISAAVDKPALTYRQDTVQPVMFDPQGVWTIARVAGKSEVPSLGRVRQRRLLGSQISIRGNRVDFWNKKVMSWKEPFPTPVIGQETYDTQSKEFWLDFRTDPKRLNLPQYVSAVDVELGTLLATKDGRVLFGFDGVWFTLEKSGGENSRTL